MTSERLCPDCAHPGNRGSFCTQCGASLDVPACARCDTRLADLMAYCPGCGRAVESSIRRARALAGIGAVIAALSIGWIAGAWAGGGSDRGMATDGMAALASVAPAPEIGAMSPRERADRLFDRVMRAIAAGDSAEARRFVPMAVAAHQQVDRLDADLRFHLAVLGMIDGRPEVAADYSRAILEETSTHLFGLHSAAQAAAALGDEEAARGYFERLLAVYAEEAVLDRPEYETHAPLIPYMRRDAERFLEAAR